ncbi:hypothetical protein R9X47_01765 [Wukongibacter baidiensis]|uniref:hypothetical protein n=1 Tax=Wukongibacter baidiensis TaxID=1723361 RepID=UPI003D7FFBCB
MKKVFIIVFISATLFSTACGNSNDDKTRRLSSQVISLKQELQIVKEERDNIKLKFETYRENYRVSQLSKEDLVDEVIKTDMKTFNPQGSLQQIFLMSKPYHNHEFRQYYGEILNKRLKEDGFNEFITQLSKNDSDLIDRVINYLLWELQRKEGPEGLKKNLVNYKSNLLDKSNDKKRYIIYRMYILIDDI